MIQCVCAYASKLDESFTPHTRKYKALKRCEKAAMSEIKCPVPYSLNLVWCWLHYGETCGGCEEYSHVCRMWAIWLSRYSCIVRNWLTLFPQHSVRLKSSITIHAPIPCVFHHHLCHVAATVMAVVMSWHAYGHLNELLVWLTKMGWHFLCNAAFAVVDNCLTWMQLIICNNLAT